MWVLSTAASPERLEQAIQGCIEVGTGLNLAAHRARSAIGTPALVITTA